jgi:hypothetical protein
MFPFPGFAGIICHRAAERSIHLLKDALTYGGGEDPSAGFAPAGSAPGNSASSGTAFSSGSV